MSIRKLVLILLLVGATPARAWWFADDDASWPIFDFHRYGGDVNRPAATPDRPYFHGDDAVPLGLRWRDLPAAEQQAAAEDAAAAAAVAVDGPAPRRVARRHAVRHRQAARRRPPVCVPARSAAAH